MAKRVNGRPKKAYAKPALTTHGTVRDLTQKQLTGLRGDSGHRPRSRTAL
jgi:hypothetical protein